MEIDEHSTTWRAVQEWAAGQINRRIEDLIDRDDDRARGAILVLKDLLDLPERDRAPMAAASGGENDYESY